MALVTVTTSGAEPRSYELNKPRFVFGRDPNADVHLDNLAISKNHFEIVKEGDAYLLRDLKSSNKTYVNGKEVQEHHLNNGDEIVAGNFKIVFAGAVVVEARPKPATEESFEPTLQLPPEMIRKKMEEMQREKEQGGVGAARAAAATAAKRPQTASNSQAGQPATTSNAGSSGSSSGGSNMAAMLVIGAIVVVVIVNIIIYLRQH